MAVKSHCKGCVKHNKGQAGTRYEDWCCAHGNTAKKARSICILQGSKVTQQEWAKKQGVAA